MTSHFSIKTFAALAVVAGAALLAAPAHADTLRAVVVPQPGMLLALNVQDHDRGREVRDVRPVKVVPVRKPCRECRVVRHDYRYGHRHGHRHGHGPVAVRHAGHPVVAYGYGHR